jgi:hypothetical protein
MVKRLWVYFRKSLLIAGEVMGRKSHRPQKPSRLGLGLLGLCLLILAPMLVCTGIALWHEWRWTENATISVPIQAHQWKSYWPASSFQVGEQSIASTYSNSTFLVTELSEQALAHAYYLQANVLYLGPIHGRFRVYLDGDLTSWASALGQTRPVTLTVPLKRLQQAEPLSVAIEISSDTSAFKRDRLDKKRGEGLVTPEVADKLIQANLWERKLIPLICATVFGVLGILFFTGWLIQRRKQEYAYFAAFSFLQAVGQICAIDFMQQVLGSSFLSELGVVLLVWEGSLAMLLGLALARTRASWMVMAICATFLATSVLLLAPWISLPAATLAKWELYLFKGFVPLAYARGALACFIQWNVLSHRRAFVSLGFEKSVRAMQRRRDLRRLTLGFFGVSILYFFQSEFVSNADPRMGVFRLTHFVLLITCYGAGWIKNQLRDDVHAVLRLTRLVRFEKLQQRDASKLQELNSKELKPKELKNAG